MRFPRYSSASRSSALRPRSSATSLPRTSILGPSSLGAALAVISSPDDPSTLLTKSTTRVMSSCDMVDHLYSGGVEFCVMLSLLGALTLRPFFRCRLFSVVGHYSYE